MSYVITAPKALAAAVTDIAGIGSSINAANAAAAAPTIEILAAGADGAGGRSVAHQLDPRVPLPHPRRVGSSGLQCIVSALGDPGVEVTYHSKIVILNLL